MHRPTIFPATNHLSPLRLGALLVFALLGLALASCGKQGQQASHGAGPQAGPQTGPRIVALSPAVAIILDDLGLRSNIVGKHDYDMILGDGVPSVGSFEEIDYEHLLSLRPTHVVLEWPDQPPLRLIEFSAQNQWKLLNLDLRDLESIRAGLIEIRDTFADVEGVGPRSDELLVRMDEAWENPDPALKDAGRVLLLISTDPPSVVGPGSFHHEALVAVGGVPAITEGSPWMELDAEDILRIAPDAIVLIQPRSVGSEPQARGTEQVIESLGRLADLDIPAVRDRKVAIDDDPLVLTPSTATIRFADRLRETLASWASGEVAP